MLDPKDFPNWQFNMRSHMSSCCVFLIDIIEQGFHPQDPLNMTPTEKANHQLNATAMRMIQTAAGPTYTTHIRVCKMAKQCWDNLHNLFLGSASIQLCKYEAVLDEAKEFVMNEDETPEDLYRRLSALAITLNDFGFEKVEDSWIKRKFLKAITPSNQSLAQTIRSRPDFSTLDSNTILSEFVSIGMVVKSSIHAHARQRGLAGHSPNVALKSKATTSESEYEQEDDEDDVQETKDDFCEHIALVTRTYWSNRSREGRSSNKKKFGKLRGERPKTCYNCSILNHYIAQCPWENREDHNGKLVRKDSTKAISNKTYVKKRVPNALCVQDRKVLEEYMSGDEDSNEAGATARVAVATPSSTSSSLFESPNENEFIPYTCLMANATSVTPSSKPISSTPPSLLYYVENVVKEPQSPSEVDLWLATLKGEDKVNVDALLEQLEETNSLVDQKDDIISGMAIREMDYANEIADFSISLGKEQTRRGSLEEALSNLEESYAIDMSRVKKDHCSGIR
jgi:hypothetical protein